MGKGQKTTTLTTAWPPKEKAKVEKATEKLLSPLATDVWAVLSLYAWMLPTMTTATLTCEEQINPDHCHSGTNQVLASGKTRQGREKERKEKEKEKQREGERADVRQRSSAHRCCGDESQERDPTDLLEGLEQRQGPHHTGSDENPFFHAQRGHNVVHIGACTPTGPIR